MLPDISLGGLTDYISRDNQDALEIYNALVAEYESSLVHYPREVNLLGVFFFDILKLLTQSAFKYRELQEGFSPLDDSVTNSLTAWPYLGYADIAESVDVDSKVYGKDHRIKLSRKVRVFQKIAAAKGLLSFNAESVNVTCMTPMIDKSQNLWFCQGVKTNLLNAESDWFALPQLADQVKSLKRSISRVMDRTSHPLSSHLMGKLFEKHVYASCTDGKSWLKIKGEVVVLKSGVELRNRMIAISALNQDIPVVNIMHGEAFGVCDDPIFSDFGEQMYSSAILGYGEGMLAASVSYNHGMKDGVTYIPSSGVQVLQYHGEGGVNTGRLGNKLKFYYYPTTLSGSSHRYGPYRDTADTLYLTWQKRMFEIFGGSLTVKSHPKEKYYLENMFSGMRVISGGFDSVVDDIDVFVFDFIGTAFNVACATDKPIVYFDLGIRKIHPEALEHVKNRTIYINVKDGLPSMDDLLALIREEKINTYSNNYSYTQNRVPRAQALVDGIRALGYSS